MYEASIKSLGVSLKFYDDAFETLEEKSVEDINTGKKLYDAKIIGTEEGVVLLVNKKLFKKVEK